MRKRFFSNSSQTTKGLIKQHKFFSSNTNSSQPPNFFSTTTTSSQPPRPLLTVMRGFNLFPNPFPIFGKGLNTKNRRNRRFFSVLVSRDTRCIFFMLPPWKSNDTWSKVQKQIPSKRRNRRFFSVLVSRDTR